MGRGRVCKQQAAPSESGASALSGVHEHTEHRVHSLSSEKTPTGAAIMGGTGRPKYQRMATIQAPQASKLGRREKRT